MKKENKTVILTVSEGKIDNLSSRLLKDELQVLYKEGFRDIVLDFSFVTGIDSIGLGKLLMFQKKLKECGGRLIITNITNEYIRETFKMIRLHKVIDIKDRTGSKKWGSN